MFKVAVAHSIELDSADAVADVLAQCREQLGGMKPQAALLFAGIDHDFALILKRINDTYPEIELIGCTTDGEISSVHGYADDSLVFVAFCSDEIFFKAGLAGGISENPIKSVSKAADSAVLELGQDPVLCIATPSGLSPKGIILNGDSILDGFRMSLPEAFPVFGGAAADQWRLNGTFQFYNQTVATDALSFLLVGGPLLYSFQVESGWTPIGQKEQVTKADNNVVYKIGADTALQFYKHYLGESILIEEPMATAAHPMAVYEKDGNGYYFRASLARTYHRNHVDFCP